MNYRLLVLVAVLMLAGCATSAPNPCGDPIRVPAPYWNPPQDLPTLIPPPTPTLEHYQCPPDATAQRCTELQLEVALAAFLELLADSEYCRNQYSEVVTFVQSVPPVTPPPPVGDAPPLPD